MTTVADLVAWIEGFAPPSLAEPWDNVGLLWGDPAATVDRVMTCLTVTGTTADEAIAEGAGLIVAHHPILFRGAKSVRADRPESAFLWRLARAGIAVASPHTAFDNAEGGINDGLARRLGLVDVGPLRQPTAAARPRFKVVVFAPEADRGPVLDAAFGAGAGRIGRYRECSFGGMGQGTFFGEEGSDPTVGAAGRRESVDEWRLEVACPGDRLAATLAAIREAHSYEEPAIDFYPLHDPPEGPGVGRLGRLESLRPLAEFAAEVARRLDAPGLQYAGDPARRIERVAIACGAGDDFLADAARAGADALVTGEARYHRAVEAEALGVGLIVAGHHATERPGVEDLVGLLGAAFPTLDCWASRRERDPLSAP